MQMKAVIALVLGLVFQLAQVLPAAVITGSCAPVASSCQCCANGETCECASCGETPQAPAPIVPADQLNELKIPTMQRTETAVAVVTTGSVRVLPTASTVIGSKMVYGYQGVRFAVAFCSFVI